MFTMNEVDLHPSTVALYAGIQVNRPVTVSIN
jgi:hypothetical protein